MTLEAFNSAPPEQKTEWLQMCCGSDQWIRLMMKQFPFADEEALLQAGKVTWQNLTIADWQQAFENHPRIGDLNSLKEKFANTANWASGEQAGVSGSDEKILRDFAEANKKYERRFGFIFIVCATGKSASEMLDILKSRLDNSPEKEIQIAAEEQNKITQLRLRKLLNS